MKRIIFIGLVCLAACKKNQNCQTWKFYDECVPKSSQVVCNNPDPPAYETGTFCGSQLSGVSSGSSKVIHEDADAKMVRHFVQKVN